MKKLIASLMGLALALIIITPSFDPDPPPGHIYASVDKDLQVNTYSDPDPPPGLKF